MPVRVSSSVKNASTTRIVLSQKCQYPYRPQSKMPIRISSSVKNASTRIVHCQKCQYVYRPQSKIPVRVSSSVENASKMPVPALVTQYPHRHVAHMGTYMYISWLGIILVCFCLLDTYIPSVTMAQMATCQIASACGVISRSTPSHYS